MIYYGTLGFGQFVDLQYDPGINGYLWQTVNLPYSGNYNLSFYQKAKTTYYARYVMEVIWNGQLIATQMANTTNVTHESFVVQGIQGPNIIKFN